MKLWKIVLFVTVALVGASCGTYKLSSYEPQKNYFQTITSSYELKRKMQTDWLFRQNYITFAVNQSRSWYNEYYSQNYMFKTNFSSFDFYWNRHEIWWDWGFNSYNWWGYKWYVPSYYSYWPRTYAWHGDVAFMNGRRLSNTVVIKKRKSNIDKVYNKLKTIVKENPNITINKGRNNNSKRNYSEPRFTPRIDPNKGRSINNNFTNNNSRSAPDITARPSGSILLKSKK
tara:strand:- start:1844 stop:2530 length:687 start_codon:yes stop_codon:yes gene_type:complete